MRKNTSPGFTLVELLTVIAILAILVGMLIPAVQAVRAAARRSQCSSNVRQQAHALTVYASSKGRFPMGAKGTLPGISYDPTNPEHAAQGASWTAYILPYIEQENLFDDLGFTEADSWANGPGEVACSTYLSVYRCPSDIAPVEFTTNNIEGRVPCSYLGCAGGNVVIDNGNEADPGDVDFADGILYNRSRVTKDDCLDGLSNTIICGESLFVWESCMDHWYIGSTNVDGDFDFSEFLGSTAAPINNWKRVGDLGDCTANALNELAFGSWHPANGANMAFADGRVEYITGDIDPVIYKALGSRRGGEIIPGRD